MNKYYVSNQCEDGAVTKAVEAWCEHCGKLPMGSVMVSENGTWYCQDCAEACLTASETLELQRVIADCVFSLKDKERIKTEIKRLERLLKE